MLFAFSKYNFSYCSSPCTMTESDEVFFFTMITDKCNVGSMKCLPKLIRGGFCFNHIRCSALTSWIDVVRLSSQSKGIQEVHKLRKETVAWFHQSSKWSTWTILNLQWLKQNTFICSQRSKLWTLLCCWIFLSFVLMSTGEISLTLWSLCSTPQNVRKRKFFKNMLALNCRHTTTVWTPDSYFYSVNIAIIIFKCE